MAEMTTLQKLQRQVMDNMSPSNLLRLLEHDQVETLDKLKKVKDADDFRFIQGQLFVLDKYIEVLTNAIS